MYSQYGLSLRNVSSVPKFITQSSTFLQSSRSLFYLYSTQLLIQGHHSYANCGLCICIIGLTGKYQKYCILGPPQTYWIRIYILTSYPSLQNSKAYSSWMSKWELVLVIILKFFFYERSSIDPSAWGLQGLLISVLCPLALWPVEHGCPAMVAVGLWEVEACSFCFRIHFCWPPVCLRSKFPTSFPFPCTLDSALQASTCLKLPTELPIHLVSFPSLLSLALFTL